MIRLVNDMNGFSYFNSTNTDVFGVGAYPDQYGEYIDRYTTLRFQDTAHFNSYYRFKIQKKYANYNPVITQDHPKFFRIVRFDKGGPDKAILIGDTLGEVVVAKASELLTLQNIEGAEFDTVNRRKAEQLNYKYFEPNEPFGPYDLLAFFEKYNIEKIWEYPVQDYDLLGRIVWIEYNKSLNDSKSSENTIHTTDSETGEDIPIKNDFTFTSAMREWIITNNRKLEREPDYYLAYYPYTYNIHAQTRIDMPRRSYTQGVIIRADVQGVEPHIVVMEVTDNNVIRFVCDDEARFYFDTTIENNGTAFNAYTVSKQYTPYGFIDDIEPEDEEEESEEEVTPEEEESDSEENNEGENSEEENSDLPTYDDVIIHIKTYPEEEESEEINPEDEEESEETNPENNNEESNIYNI